MKFSRTDLFGGFAAAVVALPLALAFGVSSGLGALAGLYGAIAVGFFASVFGGTPVQISGPTGPMTVVMATVVLHFSGEPEKAFSVVILAGLIQLLFGLAKFGRYIKLVPQPVISGFMSGIGVIVILSQIAPLTGFDSAQGGTLAAIAALPRMLAQLNPNALILGLASFAIASFLPRAISRFVPAPLLAVFAGSLLGIYFFPQTSVIGDIPTGLPSLVFPDIELAEVPYIIRFALVLAFLGSIDSLLTSLVADGIARTTHDSNKELVGQGIGNMIAGIVGGIPGAGATMRTMVNIKAGGVSAASGAIHASILFLIVVFFSDLASQIPLAVLAGILLKVGIDIIDWRGLRRALQAPRKAVFIMFTTLVLTVLVDLMTAVAVGIVMAAVLYVARTAEAQMSSARFAFGSSDGVNLTEQEAAILDAADGRIVLFHVEGPLSFASARDISRMLQNSGDKDVLAIDLSHVPFIDSSACAALEEVIKALHAIGDEVIIFGARPLVMDYLQKTQVLPLLQDGRLADSQLEALQKAQKFLTQNNFAGEHTEQV